MILQLRTWNPEPDGQPARTLARVVVEESGISAAITRGVKVSDLVVEGIREVLKRKS